MKKIILITGSTDGIGKLAAIRFAEQGHQVFIHGRNAEKLYSTIEEIKSISGNEEVDGFIADFADLDAVREMAKEVKNKVTKIDVLINNAGVFKSQQQLNKDGIDLRLVVNYLAPVLLTTELTSLLEGGSSSRLINLSSAAQGTVSLAALYGKESLEVSEAYAQSKLALTMWGFDLAQRLKNTTVIALNPGSLLNTKMVQEAYGQYWSPAEKGTDIIFELALLDKYEGVTNKYFDNDKGVFSNAHADAYDENKIIELLNTTNQVL